MNEGTQLFDLTGHTAVMTGGGGVLAGVMAESLISAGAAVSLWGRGRSAPVASVVDEIREKTGRPDKVHGATVDTGDKESVVQAFERTAGEFGVPDILVNGVGGNIGKSSFLEADLDTFRKVLEMNIIAGLMVPTQVFAEYWIENQIEGTVINMASMASYIPLSGVWAYDASKAAVMNLTMAAAKEFAPHRIRVNAIAPGFFIGHQNKNLLIADEESGTLTQRGQDIIGHTPFGRFGDQSDLAGTTIFLASTRASGFVTGVTIPVDGGYLIHNV
ncbi:MAG: SDR family oxidoreductase [Sediminispirochaetaceae bacterium]